MPLPSRPRWFRLAPLGLLVAVGCSLDSPTLPLNSIIVKLCSNVAWAAYQDPRTSDWVKFADGDGTYALDVRDKVGIAVVTTAVPNTPTLHVSFLSASETAAAFRCADSTGAESMHGAVASVAAGNVVTVALGPAHAVVPAGQTTFTIDNVPAGAVDLVAANGHPRGGDTLDVTNAIIRRAQNFADGATIPTLDFGAPESFSPGVNTFTVTNPAGGPLHVTSTFYSATGASAVLGVHTGTQNTAPIYSVPAGLLAQGDIQRLTMQTSGTGTATLGADLFYRSPVDQALQLGPDPNLPAFTVLSGSILRPKVDVATQPEYGQWARFTLSRPAGAEHGETIILDVTRGYWGGQPPNWSVVVPDFGGVAGFDAAWAPPSGSYAWTMAVSGVPYVFGFVQDGAVFRFARLFGTTTF